ncbi:hypothetical protein [uncultured Brevundimonas sp.]|uniref:hypothetical protein n=1 Tax=uncultured Brevundimonas sp. TaxID=213418 RepID=UPI0025F07CDC|nr:hypothetical protein [uncultured Brevundimonas sp.]
MQTVQPQVTQINELIVFGAGCSDLASCSAMYPEYSTDMAMLDQTTYKCETNMDDLTCSVQHTKNKD